MKIDGLDRGPKEDKDYALETAFSLLKSSSATAADGWKWLRIDPEKKQASSLTSSLARLQE
jgi:hypothetical protein